MLEAKDFKTVELVQSFIGTAADHLCGEDSATHVVNVFVTYVDNAMFVHRRKCPVSWADDNADKLSTFITIFERKGP